MKMHIINTSLKKYQNLGMDGYTCNGESNITILMHLSRRFNISEAEIRKNFYKGKIRISCINDNG